MIDLYDWKDGIDIYWYGEDDRKSRIGLWAWLRGYFGFDKFYMFIRFLSGDGSG